MLSLGCDTSLLPFPRVYPEDTEEAVRQCELLLAEQDFDDAIRHGDVLGFLVQHYAQVEEFHTVSEIFFHPTELILYTCAAWWSVALMQEDIPW